MFRFPKLRRVGEYSAPRREHLPDTKSQIPKNAITTLTSNVSKDPLASYRENIANEFRTRTGGAYLYRGKSPKLSPRRGGALPEIIFIRASGAPRFVYAILARMRSWTLGKRIMARSTC